MADSNNLDSQIQKKLEEVMGGSDDLLAEIYNLAGDQAGLSSVEDTKSVVDEEEKKCDINVSVHSGEMVASLCVYSSKDMLPITMDAIKQAIGKKNVTYGIDWDMLQGIVDNQSYDKIFEFAHGDPKTDGVNGKVTSRYDETRKLTPKLLEDGSVDFRDLGVVVNVSAGDPICDIQMNTMGTDGKNVHGEIVRAIPGVAPKLLIGKNTAVNGDQTLLIATKDGSLVFENDRFCVETEYVVRGDVDVSTGNINFIGDIHIKGNVEPSFRVESAKNIYVDGSINGAVVKAGREIVVKKGVVNSEITTDGGSVKLDFGENTKIKCKGACRASSLVSCNIVAEGGLECNMGQGCIVGGTCTVYGNLTCNVLGHKNYIQTTIELGERAPLLREENEIKDKIAKIDVDVERLEKAYSLLKSLRDGGVDIGGSKLQFMNVSIRMKMQKAKEKQQLLTRLFELENLISEAGNLTISVNRALYPNVRLSIAGISVANRAEYGKCVVSCNGDEVLIK